MRLRTRVFDLAPQYGYQTDRELARAMDVTESMVSRVKNGVHKITQTFIEHALLAFPDKSMADLFYFDETDDEPAEALVAS